MFWTVLLVPKIEVLGSKVFEEVAIQQTRESWVSIIFEIMLDSCWAPPGGLSCTRTSFPATTLL